MKKKTNLKPKHTTLDAALLGDLLWPKNPDGTPMVFPEPEIDPATKAEWDARMAARAKHSAELNERRAKGEKISPFLCY